MMRYPSEEELNQMMGMNTGDGMGQIIRDQRRIMPRSPLPQIARGAVRRRRRRPMRSYRYPRSKYRVPSTSPMSYPRSKYRVSMQTPYAQHFICYAPRIQDWSRRRGFAGNGNIGNLYEDYNDPSYLVQGLTDYEDLDGLGQDELIDMMGIGVPGEVRVGPDNSLYQWVEGVDGLGNLTGFWDKIVSYGKRVLNKLPSYINHPVVRSLRPLLKPALRKVLPVAQQVASAIPHPAAQKIALGLRTATPILRSAGFAGYEGLGALYATPDGTLWADSEILNGLAADEEELYGFADEYEEMDGLADEYEEMDGLADEYEDMDGLGQCYVQREDNIYGVEGYVPHHPPETRRCKEPAQAPKMWQSPW